MIYAEVVGGSIETNATSRDKDLMRSIPGSRFSSPPPTWTVPLTWTACLQLRGTFGAQLQIGPRLVEWATEESHRIKYASSLREQLDAPDLPTPPPAGRELRPFQKADVLWALVVGSGALMLPTGTGKTVSILTWARQLGLERVLVICLASKKLDWVDECRLWYPELPAVDASGSAAARRDLIEECGQYGGLVAVGLEALKGHTRLAPYGQVELTAAQKTPKVINQFQWDAVIMDEGHRMADPKSQQTRACWAAAKGAEYRWALTATPTTKGIDTFWPVLHFVAPHEHPSRSKYVERYATSTTNFWGGVTVGAVRPEMAREYEEVIRPRTRRIPKEIALPGLPQITPITRMVPMSPQQAAAYKQMADKLIAKIEAQTVVVATSTAAQYVRLGQLASSYAEVEEEWIDPETEKLRQRIELRLPSSKIDAFVEDLQDWIPQEESVIGFATSRRLIDLASTVLARKKIKHSIVKGGQKEIERHEQVAAFQRGEVPVILVVMAAGGTGLNLQRARIGAFLQRSWSRVDDIQAEGRFQRIGSEMHESLLRVDYIAPDTVEIGQLDVLASKDDTMQSSVLRDKELIKRMVRGQHIYSGVPA